MCHRPPGSRADREAALPFQRDHVAIRIHDVKIRNLEVIPDERGRLMEMLRADDELFRGFGQLYLTTAYPGVVKAWHLHRKQWDHFVCVAGMAKVVLFDNRPESRTCGEVNEFFLGEHNPILVQVPPMVYHGFKCISDREAIMINCPTEVYNREDPDEVRLDPYDNDIPYDWARKDA